MSSWQVNGIPLIGETHKEVVNILKELPMHVCLVCSRILPPTIPDSDEEDDDDVHLTLKELLAEFNDKVELTLTLTFITEKTHVCQIKITADVQLNR